MAATSLTASQIAFAPAGGVAAQNVQAGVVEVAGDVVAEVAARELAISEEVTARTQAIADALGSVDLSGLATTAELVAEALVRQNADDALDGRLDTVESSSGVVYARTRPAAPIVGTTWTQVDAFGNPTGRVEAFTFDAGAPTAVPANIVLPVVTPSAPIPGQVATSTAGTWSNYPTAFTYQWQIDGVNIIGAITSTYTTQSGDPGHAIRCVVTASNNIGSTSAASAAITPVSVLTPAQIFAADLVAWYDQATLVGADGTAIASWTDQSGNGNHLTNATGSQQPTILTHAIDGLKCASFNPANSQRLTRAIASLPQPYALILVFRPRTAVSPRTTAAMFAFGSGGNALQGKVVDSNVNGQYSLGVGGVANILPNAGTVLAGSPFHQWTFIVNGASSRILKNGGALASGTGTIGAGNTGTPFILGTDNAVSTFEDMDVRAAVLVKRDPSAGDLTGLGNYGRAVWGTP